MPAVLPENAEAMRIYSDINSFGWEGAAALNRLSLSDEDGDNLLLRLRVIASEVSAIEHERLKQAKRKDGGNRG